MGFGFVMKKGSQLYNLGVLIRFFKDENPMELFFAWVYRTSEVKKMKYFLNQLLFLKQRDMEPWIVLRILMKFYIRKKNVEEGCGALSGKLWISRMF